MVAVAADMRTLASATASIGWDRDPSELIADPTDLGAKPIPKDAWQRAFVVALAMSKIANIAPVPGADPEGFVWLTWTRGSRGLALELRPGKYKWTQRDGAGKRTVESDSLDDVGQALRSVIGAS
jgi:hypothetical protein